MGALLVDNSVAALAPNAFTRQEVLFGDADDQTQPPDTVAYFIYC